MKLGVEIPEETGPFSDKMAHIFCIGINIMYNIMRLEDRPIKNFHQSSPGTPLRQ